MKLQVIGILSSLAYATATEHSQADEPGIGIDLSMAYGTAAVKFRNGTIIDLGKIDGSTEYRLAMQELAQDALDVRQGKPSRLTQEVFIHPKQLMSLFPIGPLLTRPSTLYEFLLQQAQRVMPFLIPKKRTSTDFWIVAVTEMLSNLKRLIKILQPSIKYDLIILSYPDFEAGTNHIYKDRFLIASDQAGLEVLRSKITSQSAMEYYGIVDCEDEITNLHCNGSSMEKISTVLTVTYNEASLGTTILNRQLGALFPDRVGENFKYGASSPLRIEDKGQYWIEIKNLISETIKGTHIDYLIVLGSHAMDVNLLGIISSTLKEHGSGEAWERYFTKSCTSEEHLYAAARGDAVIARRGMINGFDACLVPETCKRPEAEVENATYSLPKTKAEL